MKRFALGVYVRVMFILTLGVAFSVQFAPASWAQQNSGAGQASAAASRPSAGTSQPHPGASASTSTQNAADAPASKEDIERYLTAMDTPEMMKNVMAAMTQQMHKIVHEQAQKQPNLPVDFEARTDKMLDDMFKDFPVQELIDVMVPVYQKHLTKGDVDGLVAFYTSPTGKKVLKEMPAMMQESMQAASGVAQKLMAEANERVKIQIAEETKKDDAGAKKDAAPAASAPAPTPN
jgi:hypothetical protein